MKLEDKKRMHQVDGTVTLNAKLADGTTKEYTAPVKYLEFAPAGADGFDELRKYVQIATDEKQAGERREELIKGVNYAFSLWARATVRQDLQRQVDGPDRSINKMVAEFVKARTAAGKATSEKMIAAFRASLIAAAAEDEAA